MYRTRFPRCQVKWSPVTLEQFDWIALGAPANEGYGVRGISSGRMPYFVDMLTEKQIDLIVAYERNL